MSKVYDYVTQRIIESLEKGVIPWRRPWNGGASPTNLKSKKPYRGINTILLGTMGFASHYFLTFKQIKEYGGKIKKGEKSNMVVFFKIIESKQQNHKGKPKTFPMLRYYNVWNVTQCENVDYPKPEQNINPVNPINPITKCVELWDKFTDSPDIKHNSQIACYIPATDKIRMPDRQLFTSSEEYYSTLFHEGIHSTGHTSRLDRKLETHSVGSNYAKEELIAEIGAAFLCGMVNIEHKTIDNSSAYIATWLKRLKNDNKLIVAAASKAQTAADYIQGVNVRKPDSRKPDSLVNAS